MLARSSDYVRLAWNGIGGVSKYDIWRNTASNATTAVKLVDGQSGTGYYDYGAAPGQLYYYWVAVHSATNTDWFSAGDSGWRPGAGTLSPAQRTHDAGGGSGTIEVDAAVQVHWTATESLNWVTLDSGFPDTGTGTVAYTVSAYAGNTARTGTLTVANQDFKVFQEPFGTPQNVQASDGTFADRTEISWDVLAHADRYYLYRNDTNTVNGASYIGYVTTNACSDIGGIENRTYLYWVRPYNAGGYGDYGVPDTGFRGSGGVPPGWIGQFFPGGYPGDLADSDGDRFSNYDEFIAGSDPTNSASYLRIVRQEELPASGFRVEWSPSISNRWYTLNWTNRLGGVFQPLETSIEFPQNSCTDTLHQTEDSGFYRVEVRLK